jgi:3-hydroxyacyl-CoA dehydrogenase
MGIGISQVASQIAKINVVIVDTQKTILDKNINFMGMYLLATSDPAGLTSVNRFYLGQECC